MGIHESYCGFFFHDTEKEQVFLCRYDFKVFFELFFYNDDEENLNDEYE